MNVNDIRDISILIGIWVTIYGIDSWRREFRGKRQIELAEETLALFYEASDAISHVRSPFAFSFEHENIERDASDTDASYEAKKKASVVFYRYKQHSELFNKLRSMRYRFMAAFGKKRANPFDELHSIVHEILVSARMLGQLWARDYYHNEMARKEHHEHVKKHEAVFWYQGENDIIAPRVDNVINRIDEICRDIILGKGTMYYLINKNLKWQKKPWS